ncbi:hypothetical protein YB2330_003671 [Saitoella coloradoensis]
MSSKYSSLPDLDTSNPDIYETPDVPDLTDASTAEEDFSNDNIFRDGLSVIDARARFANESVDASSADFSDSIAPGRRRGVGGAGRGIRTYTNVRPTETVGERVARLKREIEEVKLQAQAEADREGKEVGLAEIARLEEALPATSVGRGPRVFTRELTTAQPIQAPPSTALVHDSVVTIDPQSATLLSALDTRLAHLESALGLDTTSTISNSTSAPILQSLSTINAKLSLFSVPDDVLKSKTDALRTLSSISSKTDTPTDAKVAALYAALPTLDTLSPLLPPTISRLRTLHALHADASTQHTLLSTLEQKQTQLRTDLDAWREALERVEGGLEGVQEGVRKNVEVVEGWVRGVEGRLEKLE